MGGRGQNPFLRDRPPRIFRGRKLLGQSEQLGNRRLLIGKLTVTDSECSAPHKPVRSGDNASMRYTDLAYELAIENKQSPEDALVDLMAVLRDNGWGIDLDPGQVALAREQYVAQTLMIGFLPVG